MHQILRATSRRLMQREADRTRHAYFATPDVAEARRSPLWTRATAVVMAGVMYLSPIAFLYDEVAHAAPIVDPRAPISFQPSVTQTSTGVPAVNIAAPNANGVSVNSYQAFDVGAAGLVLNNSVVAGTPLLGGTLAANPNLSGRTAALIINQVTSTGPASALLGPLEVFGNSAAVVVSNPNGISVNGLALTNIPGLVLTTGTPQFLTGVGGTSTTFANAGAAAYQVAGGNITINGPAGNMGSQARASKGPWATST
jgi:filamentous hemagglutinin